MKIHIITIVLDGFPFLPMQLACFNRLTCDWTWHIVEGAAANSGSTKWCQKQLPRLSNDGSTQFINSLRNHPRVRVYQRQWWEGGKDEMVNEPLKEIKEPCFLMEIDVDELWNSDMIDWIGAIFKGPVGSGHNCAYFRCRYFLGPNIVSTMNDSYGNNKGEWLRFWKFYPGFRFISHEPPVLSRVNDTTENNAGGPVDNENPFTRAETSKLGFVFDHWAYVFPRQVIYKEEFYGYKDALKHWYRLQNNKVWPVTKLKDFLPWVDERAQADLLYKL